MNHVNAYYATARKLKQDRTFELASSSIHESNLSKVQFFFSQNDFPEAHQQNVRPVFLLFTGILNVSGHPLIFLTDSVFFKVTLQARESNMGARKDGALEGEKKRKKLDFNDT